MVKLRNVATTLIGLENNDAASTKTTTITSKRSSLSSRSSSPPSSSGSSSSYVFYFEINKNNLSHCSSTSKTWTSSGGALDSTFTSKNSFSQFDIDANQFSDKSSLTCKATGLGCSCGGGCITDCESGCKGYSKSGSQCLDSCSSLNGGTPKCSEASLAWRRDDVSHNGSCSITYNVYTPKSYTTSVNVKNYSLPPNAYSYYNSAPFTPTLELLATSYETNGYVLDSDTLALYKLTYDPLTSSSVSSSSSSSLPYQINDLLAMIGNNNSTTSNTQVQGIYIMQPTSNQDSLNFSTAKNLLIDYQNLTGDMKNTLFYNKTTIPVVGSNPCSIGSNVCSTGFTTYCNSTDTYNNSYCLSGYADTIGSTSNGLNASIKTNLYSICSTLYNQSLSPSSSTPTSVASFSTNLGQSTNTATKSTTTRPRLRGSVRNNNKSTSFKTTTVVSPPSKNKSNLSETCACFLPASVYSDYINSFAKTAPSLADQLKTETPYCYYPKCIGNTVNPVVKGFVCPNNEITTCIQNQYTTLDAGTDISSVNENSSQVMKSCGAGATSSPSKNQNSKSYQKSSSASGKSSGSYKSSSGSSGTNSGSSGTNSGSSGTSSGSSSGTKSSGTKSSGSISGSSSSGMTQSDKDILLLILIVIICLLLYYFY